MAFIEVKQDPSIEHSDVVVGLGRDTDVVQVGDEKYEKNLTDLMQTSVYGVVCPIIEINNIVIQMDDIRNFVLDDTGKVPTVTAVIHDRYNMTQYFDSPGPDNEMRVIILPPFDNAYKKINLTFYITNFTVISRESSIYSVTGTYKLPGLSNSQYKSFGEISTYKLFEEIAKELKLGFATNVEDKEDKKFVYTNFNSYLDILGRSVKNTEGKDIIYDWYIDCWDYLILMDVKDRLNTIVSDEDNQIWVSNLIDAVQPNTTIIPLQIIGTLTNAYGAKESQIYVKDYRKISNASNNKSTDKVVSIYKMDENNYNDTYLGNEDVKKDIFEKYVYKGEVYGDYDYKTAEECNKAFQQKMKLDQIEVDLNQPLLALCRGEKINFECYFDDSRLTEIENSLKEEGAIQEVQTTTNTEDPNPDNLPDQFKLDKSVTGQYLIVGNKYKFANNQWTHTCILTRPLDQKVDLFNLSGEQSNKEKRYNPVDIKTSPPGINKKDGDSSNNSTNDGSTTARPAAGKWFEFVKKMGEWYTNNVHTYQGTRQAPRTGRKTYQCPLINGNVQDDCSSFVKACLQYFGIKGLGHVSTAAMQPGTKFDQTLIANGFQRIPYSFEILQPGDIVCGRSATHTEIYAGNNKTYSWGSVHDGQGGTSKLPSGYYKMPKNRGETSPGKGDGGYVYIWRYIGK